MATRDKSQGISFSFDSFYDLYRKTKAGEEVKSSPHVIRVQNPVSDKPLPMGKPMRARVSKAPKTGELKSVPKHLADATQGPHPLGPAFQDVRDGLKKLDDQHKRLQYLLKELESYMKK